MPAQLYATQANIPFQLLNADPDSAAGLINDTIRFTTNKLVDDIRAIGGITLDWTTFGVAVSPGDFLNALVVTVTGYAE